jgi:GntR family transcriptional repressor for pyruvate dehydrogenase complex
VTDTSPQEFALKRVTRTSLSDEIVSQLIDLISKGVLAPGDRLPPERELCKKFGVGRTSLREALRSLAVMGILNGRIGEGTFVSSNNQYLERAMKWGLLLDPKKVQDLLETRIMLESQTAFLAAERATPEDLEALEESLRNLESALNKPDQFLEHDLQFHLTIAKATQNSILLNLLGMIRGHLQEWIRNSLGQPAARGFDKRATMSRDEHQTILLALQERNPESARRAMHDHIISSSVDLRDRLAKEDDLIHPFPEEN